MSTLKVNAIEPTSGNVVVVNSELLIKSPSGDITLGGTGSSNLSASYAATAGCASSINISSIVPGDTTTSIVLVNDQAVGCQSTFIDTGLTYNASTNVLSTTVTTAQTASFATNSLSASYATNAQTASYVNVLNQDVTINGNVTASGDLRFPNTGSGVVRPITSLIPNGTASYNPSSTNTTAYSNYGINLITTATSQSYCLRLPQTPTKGKTVTIINNSGINVTVFPSMIGGDINGMIDGYTIIPSDGKSYSFDCYENPLPGGWSLSNSTTTGNVSIATGEINWAFTSTSSRVTGYINDSIKSVGVGPSPFPVWSSLDLPQYSAGQNISPPYPDLYAGVYIFPDTIPGTGVWKSIDSIQIQTNIKGNLAPFFYSTFGNGFASEMYYNPSNPNATPGVNSMPWLYPIYSSPSYTTFNTNVRTPWFTAHPGTNGLYNGSQVGINAAQTIATTIPGVFIPSAASSYASDNVGDPGTLSFNLSNVYIKMIGRNYIGSFVHPTEGLIDSWYSSNFSSFFGAYPGAPFIPNIKFNTVFNVQI
jgi:hypothetical protein